MKHDRVLNVKSIVILERGEEMSDQDYCSASTIFADDYELFIDHGDGQRTKLGENEETFRDLQRFLLQQTNLLASSTAEKKEARRTVSVDDDRAESNLVSTHRSHVPPRELPAQPSFPIRHTIVLNQTWLSNKSENGRVRSSKCRLGLRIAVNGASKSLRSSTIPSANTSLSKGDFGDDAGIIVKTNETCFVALADGAGGNRALGLNPADFSRGLLSACRTVIEEKYPTSHQLPEIVLAALDKVQNTNVRGSGTLCLLGLDREKRILTSLNIGDSGFVIYRANRIHHRSQCTTDPESQGPRQLFVLDHSVGLPSLRSKNDILHQASLERIPVEKDDLIILSSDGLWDVIECDQLESLIQHHQDLPQLAEQLLKFAMRGYIHYGRDDILVIVCRVEEY